MGDKMEFKNKHILKIFIGILLLLLILPPSFSFFDFGPNTIENNKTIELNGVRLTVPESNNYSTNDSCTLSHVNDTNKFGNDLIKSSEITTGNAYQYFDYEHNLSIWVCDANRTAYTEQADGMEIETYDGQLERDFWQKRTLGDKTIVMYVTEDEKLSKLIIDSATLI